MFARASLLFFFLLERVISPELLPGHAAGTIRVDSSWSLSEMDLDQKTTGFPYFVQARPQNLPPANQSVAVP